MKRSKRFSLEIAEKIFTCPECDANNVVFVTITPSKSLRRGMFCSHYRSNTIKKIDQKELKNILEREKIETSDLLAYLSSLKSSNSLLDEVKKILISHLTNIDRASLLCSPPPFE
jgi:hypothetical protein